MDLNRIVTYLIISLVILLSSQVCFAETGNESPANGKVILASDLNQNLSQNPAGIDILDLLNQSGSSGTPASVRIIQVNPGAVYTPSAANSAPDALYLISGNAKVSADTLSVNAKSEDTVVVPEGSLFDVENIGNETLTFISALSSPVPVQETGKQNIYKIAFDGVSPILFGNETDNASFSVNRILDTNGDALPLSFDLAVVSVPMEHTIGSHYLISGEIGYMLEGSGEITIGCVPHTIKKGDIFYIPSKAEQQLTASTDMKYVLLTDPFYKPSEDFSVSSSC
ncbi:MAG TPA: cupin domain-containing protein [Methanospirillum sp.]|uniref:cupin domain-containing protein n=1 Tax=Methanospirillum sp. TaxID=45200 RepID=UPI002BB5D13F|nr:cupin domain-containing protein [Methanospirillum sp.]HWQ64974.1 cupin domain-containing protein [Methanospirillum sp.]